MSPAFSVVMSWSTGNSTAFGYVISEIYGFAASGLRQLGKDLPLCEEKELFDPLSQVTNVTPLPKIIDLIE